MGQNIGPEGANSTEIGPSHQKPAAGRDVDVRIPPYRKNLEDGPTNGRPGIHHLPGLGIRAFGKGDGAGSIRNQLHPCTHKLGAELYIIIDDQNEIGRFGAQLTDPTEARIHTARPPQVSISPDHRDPVSQNRGNLTRRAIRASVIDEDQSPILPSLVPQESGEALGDLDTVVNGQNDKNSR